MARHHAARPKGRMTHPSFRSPEVTSTTLRALASGQRKSAGDSDQPNRNAQAESQKTIMWKPGRRCKPGELGLPAPVASANVGKDLRERDRADTIRLGGDSAVCV